MELFGKGSKEKKKKGKGIPADSEVVIEATVRDKNDGHGDGRISAQTMEDIIRVVDVRMQQYGPRGGSNAGLSEEERKDLRKWVIDTPNKKKRELTIFNEKQTALMPWLRMLEHSFQPRYLYKKQNGNLVRVETGRRPGSCLTVLLDEQESCNRSKNGFLLTHVLGLARQQMEEETMAKGMTSFGRY